MSGALLADEMGLGKTVTVIGVINAVPSISRVLVICPATLRINWMRELRKWLVRPLSVGIASPKCFPTTDIVIVNYDIINRFKKSGEFYWDLLVCDEVHLIKNPKTIRARAIIGHRPTKKQIAAGELLTTGIPAKRKLGLSGTPIVNRPAELFPIINWLAPGDFPNFFKFVLRYAGAHQNGFGWDFSGATNLQELNQKLRSTLMVRRLKADVLKDLPSKRHQVIELPADDLGDLIERQIQEDDAREARLIDVRVRVELAKVSESKDDYFEAVEALRKGLAAAFAEGARIAHEIALAKVPFVIEHITEALEEGGKVILFAHHLDVLARYAAEFKGQTAIVHGEVSYEDRDRAVERFQRDSGCRLFIGGIQAAGVGLTLTASSHVVFAELDWVPGNMAQCADRAHRIGQLNSVLVQYLVLEGSLDAHKIRTLVSKQQIIDRALDQRIDVAPGGTAIKSVVIDDAKEPSPARGSVTITAREIEREAKTFTQLEIEAIHDGLRMLADCCDGARQIDGAGFNKIDTLIGKSLAMSGRLSPKQATLGKRLVTKYGRQLPTDLLSRAGIVTPQ